MTRTHDLFLTALAPAVWGASYLVVTEFLPQGVPLSIAAMRALPAGILLLLIVRQLPPLAMLGRVVVLGALNFAVFFTLLFIAAYRLPGGVAATLGAVQPILVLVLSRLLLRAPLHALSIVAALGGLVGVAMLVLGPDAALDPIGVGAALAGALSMASGVVLTRKWQPAVSPLTFTAWQLTAGGLLLLPVALWAEPTLPWPTARNLLGYLWLGLPSGALAYLLWFRGIARLGPSGVTALGFLSPLSAVMLGWIVLGQALSGAQLIGAGLVVISVWLGGRGAMGKGLPLPWRRHRVIV